ncbi:MAG: pyruvate, phosphate dikinase [Alphaproteobacteria bacterium]|uniref:Phosphoenolpyruvate synthase n=1 Tax=Candidatus Nitrobium versatile TaxID=2884831 RepID=A0A953J6G1_9BACT|nr:pyruvate, phosphate dikinase [Candidatus Nitrobium versatile]
MKRIIGIFSQKRKCLPLTEVQGGAGAKYHNFKHLLRHNHAALTAIADMEQLYYSGKPFSLTMVRIKYEELLESVTGVIRSLEALSGRSLSPLVHTVERIDEELFRNFNPNCTITTRNLVLPLEEITPEMKGMVGAKAANLAVMKNVLGLPVPNGFSVTAYAFEKFIAENRLLRPIKEELSHILSSSPEAIERAARRLREMVLEGKVPSPIEEEILRAYERIGAGSGREVRIAMRSSAVGEDTEATFAGQYETVLNVKRKDLIDAYKTVLASKYSARAIAYRMQYGLDDRETPMCVVGIEMVDSKASGVLYSVDPALRRSCPVKINSLWGVGEHLVDGSASPDVFIVDRIEKNICERHIARKESRLVSPEEGGTLLVRVPEEERERPSLDEGTVIRLANYGLLLEEFFEMPQDVEWALDGKGDLYLLQSRPLHLPDLTADETARREYEGHPVLLAQGRTASPGIATGKIFVVEREEDLSRVPRDAILVSKTASPHYATVIGRIRGMITDVGSVTSHMSSVAREFGIPAIVDAGSATSLLANGEVVTMHATTATVYKGIVEALVQEMRPAKKLIFDSPLHRRMRGILDRISPLHLTDTADPSFSPEGCRTYHDVIRYTHEMAVREMFGISGERERAGEAVKMSSTLPLQLRLVDLGGGLREGLTTCDTITPDCVESVPMKAVWRGFTHPGVSWAGTMSLDGETLISRLAVTATSELGEPDDGESYAVLSRDYLNLSARFAYHFATLDTLCGENSTQNYISLQFSGGAGSYYGRSLRIQLMGEILERLGFSVSLKGDLLEAYLARYDRASLEERLDLLGRLLASSRLLDMTLSNQEEIETYTEAFFAGEYNFLAKKRSDELRNFYVQAGYWRRVEENGHVFCLQDGSRWGRKLASEISGIMGKVVGGVYRDFLDTIEAYYYFPLAILKNCELEGGAVSVRIKPVRGNIDRAGGIAFGIRNTDNYFVLRTNALEGNVVLFEYINGRRLQRSATSKRVRTGEWHLLRVEIAGKSIRGFYNGEPVLEYTTETPLKGFAGLWTKSDSVVCFDEFTIETEGEKRNIGF